MISLFRLIAMGVLTMTLAACASGPDRVPHDPLEPFNRGVSQFNDALDDAVLEPVATAYQAVTPSPVRQGVSNFFGNWRDLYSAFNAVLQARPHVAVANFMRFNLNTFLGLGGLLDIATEARIPRTTLDFGQTLGRWGVPPGPYVVLPFLGPSTVRDTAGSILVDGQGDVITAVEHIPSRNSLYALRLVNTRANFLRAGALLDGIAIDKYSFVRDAYLQRRQRQIEDTHEDEAN